MPLAGENRAPEAFDDTVQAIAGSAPLVFDVLDNDSDPDGDRVHVTTVGAPTTGAAEVAEDGDGVVFTPPAQVRRRRRARSPSRYAIDDGRGGTAQATVTVEVIAAGEPLAPVAVDDLVGPITPGQSVEVDLLANDLDPDGNPAELVVGSDDPALADRDGGTVTIVAGPTSSRHAYTITDPAGLTDTGRGRRPRRAEPGPARRAARGADRGQHADHDRPRRPGHRPRRRHPLLHLLRQPAGRRGHDGHERRRGADGVVRPRRRLRRAGVVRLRRRRPAGPQRRRRGDRRGAAAVEPPAGRRRTRSSPSRPAPADHRPRRARDRSRPQRHADVHLDRPGRRRRGAGLDGADRHATAPLEGTDTTDSFQYTVTDAAGEAATATVSLTVTAPAAPPPAGPGRPGDDEPGPGRHRRRARQRPRPARPRPDASTSVGATTPARRRPTAATSRSRRTPTSSARRRSSTASATAPTPAPREAEAQVAVTVIGQPSAPGTPVALAGNATATVTWAAPPSNGAPIDDYELRIAGRAAVGRHPDRLHVDRPDQRRSPSRSASAPTTAPAGVRGAAPSPVVTPDIEPGRPAAPTVQFADGALIVTWSPPANEGSAITAYDIQIGGSASAVQRIGARRTFRWEGLTNGQEYTFQVRAVNAKGEGQFSSPSAPEHPLRQPDAPAAPVGERGDKYINVSWSPPGNGGDPIIEYQVQILSTGRGDHGDGHVAALVQPAQRPGPAVPGAGPQPRRLGRRARPARRRSSRAACPTRPAASAPTRGDGAATVTWAAPYDQGCAITGYTVTRQQRRVATSAAAQTSTTFGGLSNGTSYTFTVVARNEVGDSARSAASNAVVPAGPPGAPQITARHAGHRPGDGHAGTRPTPTAAPITTLPAVRQRRRLGERRHRHVDDPHGLANGTKYSFQVRAVNDVGAGAGSNTVRPARPASRRRSAASTSSGRAAADQRHLVGAERQRQADHALRGRPQPRRHRSTRPAARSRGPASPTTPATGPRPGVQRGRLRRRGAAWARRPRTAAAAARGRPGARTATPRASPAAARRRAATCVPRRHRLRAGTDRTRSRATAPSQGGFSPTQRHRPTATAAASTTPPATSATPADVLDHRSNGVESEHHQWPG